MYRLFYLPLFLLLSSADVSSAVMQGYGVKSCHEFLANQALVEKNDVNAIVDDLRYRSWLSGFVSGINLATDDDVLRGVTIDSAMRRIAIVCDEKARYSFRESSMDFLEQLRALPIPSE